MEQDHHQDSEERDVSLQTRLREQETIMAELEGHNQYHVLTANELNMTQIYKNDPLSGKEKLGGQKQLTGFFSKTVPKPSNQGQEANAVGKAEEEKSNTGKST